MKTTPDAHPERPYRPDIDGLRAVAVLLVVFDHLSIKPFFGGFVGVDVFFVISGYLIGSSLIADLDRGTFSLTAFYERRIRRIAPALIVMLAGTTALAWRYLMPGALVDYAHSLTAAVLSVSNFLFWSQSGYFDTPSSTKPLLHTWSLAVEEQFYLAFPLLLLVIMRSPRLTVRSPRRFVRPLRQHLRLILWLISLLTFGLSVWLVRVRPETAFFWSPLRAWELLLGVLVSQYRWPALTWRPLRELAALAGLISILAAGVLYRPTTPFPGLAALLPVAGAALILAAGQVGPSGAGALLSLRPMTFIGLISYSLYLWHWPLLVVQTSGLFLSDQPSYAHRPKILLLLLSFLLATLSWWFVERPFRRGPLRLPRRPLFAWTAAAVAASLLTTAVLLSRQGWPERFSPEVVHLASFSEARNPADFMAYRPGICFFDAVQSFSDFNPKVCLPVHPARRQLLLYGDSTAAMLTSGFAKAYPDYDVQQATSAGCPPYRNDAEIVAGLRPNCEALWRFIHQTYLPSHHPDVIILAAQWRQPAMDNLGAELALLHQAGIPTIVVGPEPFFETPLPVLLAIVLAHGGSPQAQSAVFEGRLDDQRPVLDHAMHAAASGGWHTAYISWFDDICPAARRLDTRDPWATAANCPLVTSEGVPLLFDNHHLTVSGSILWARAAKSLDLLPN